MTKPMPAPNPDTLPSAVTFFLTAGQRREVVRALRAIDRDRARALLLALGIKRDSDRGSDCKPG